MLTTAELLDGLNSVIAIPTVPYRDGAVDYAGHRQNIHYLMANNHLEGVRRRVISVAGTSLLHHMTSDEQVWLFNDTGKVMGKEGILMTAVVPNPIDETRAVIDRHLSLSRMPDVILIMPLTGTFSPTGLYEGLMALGTEYGPHGARFLYYLRSSRDREAVLHLLTDSAHFIGVKIGTDLEDAAFMGDRVSADKIVIWGIGDRSTDAARLGTRGHTSGTAIVATKPADSINNAQRRRDWDEAYRWEAILEALEAIRFRNGRAFNYTAVVEALNQIGHNVCGGEGGPFNPAASATLQAEVATAIADIVPLH